MYRIMTKYKSVLNKTFWQDYTVALEDGTTVEFGTDNLKELEVEIKNLTKQLVLKISE